MKLRITVQGTTYDVDVDIIENGGAPLAAPQPVAVATVAPAAVASAPAAAAPRPSSAAPTPLGVTDKTCRAPIPGNIVGVKVVAGQTVSVNDIVVVLEAMKMETPIGSPVAGKVKSVLVEVGTSVKQGQVLVEFE